MAEHVTSPMWGRFNSRALLFTRPIVQPAQMLAFAHMKRFVSLASLRCLCLMGFCLTYLCLAACQTGPSHIPPMPQLPAAALGSMIENSRYEGRRRGVKASIEPHVDVILTEADLGGGTRFNMTCKLARVTPDKCAELAQQISADAHIYKTGDTAEKTEKLTVAFMVYGR